MSWSQFVDNYLVNRVNQNTGQVSYNVCEHGAIVGFDGSVLAATPEFALGSYSESVLMADGTSSMAQIDELATLHDAFQNGGMTSRPGGIRIHREKYFVVSYDSERNLMFLRKRNGGACVAKSGTAYVIGTFSAARKTKDFSGREDPQNPGAVNIACISLQDVLLNSGV
jgi:hypothetical protein